MSSTFEQVKALVAKGQVRISDHGYDELADDGLFVRELLSGLPLAELLEDYPAFPKYARTYYASCLYRSMFT